VKNNERNLMINDSDNDFQTPPSLLPRAFVNAPWYIVKIPGWSFRKAANSILPGPGSVWLLACIHTS